ALGALAVEPGQDQAVVLGPAQLPVDVPCIVGVIVIVGLGEISLDARRERQGAAAVKAISELGLYEYIIDRARFFAAFAVGLVLDARGQAQVEGAVFFRAPDALAVPEQAGVVGNVDEGL